MGFEFKIDLTIIRTKLNECRVKRRLTIALNQSQNDSNNFFVNFLYRHIMSHQHHQI